MGDARKSAAALNRASARFGEARDALARLSAALNRLKLAVQRALAANG